MKIEEQNIQMARKLLEKAMRDLDEKFQSLPKDDSEITLEQACEIVESYDLVNHLRNIIIRQLNYLELEAKDNAEAKKLAEKIYNEWFTELLNKINGYNQIELLQIVISDGYYEKMQKIKSFFDRKLREKNLSTNNLLKIHNAINLARKEGEGRYYINKKMRELFAKTNDDLYVLLPKEEQEKARATTKSLLESVKLDRSTSRKGTSSTALSSTQLKKPKKDQKKENEDLSLSMLKTVLEKLEYISKPPGDKIVWLQFLQEQYKHLLSKNTQVAALIATRIIEAEENKRNNEIILEQVTDLLKKSNLDHTTALKADALIKKLSGVTLSEEIKQYHQTSIQMYEINVLLEMDKLLKEEIYIGDKLKRLNELVSKRSENSKEVVDRYHYINGKLVQGLAHQIIDQDRKLFKQINIEQILLLNDKDVSFQEAAKFNNMISRWVAGMILQPDINVRILMYESILNAAKICCEEGDFNGAVAIFSSGLCHSAICRLDSILAGLSPTAKATHEYLTTMLEPMRGHNTPLRQATSKFSGVSVPFIGMYRSDLTFTKQQTNKKWYEHDASIIAASTLISLQKNSNNIVVKQLSPNHDFLDHLQSSDNYGNDAYEATLYELSFKYKPKDANIPNSIAIPKRREKSLSDFSKMYFNENPDLLTNYESLITKYKLLLHDKYREKSQSEVATDEKNKELFANITRTITDIDNYVNVILRKSLSLPIDSEIISSIAYLIDQKYVKLISQLDNSSLGEELKSIFSAEKTNLEAFFIEFQEVAKHYVENEEQRELRKQAKKSLASTAVHTHSLASPQEQESSKIVEISAPITSLQQYVQLLPFNQLEPIRIEIEELTLNQQDQALRRKEEAFRAESDKKLHPSEKNDDSVKISESSDESETDQKEILELKSQVAIAEEKLIAQILKIIHSPNSLDATQAMAMVCNFRALLTKDFKQFCEIIKRFDTQAVNNLQNKLQDFLTSQVNADKQLKDLISQLSVLISYAENTTQDYDYTSNYEEAFEIFNNTYRTFEKIMKSSKELADYYAELDKPRAPLAVDLLSPVLSTEIPSSSLPATVLSQQSVPLNSEDRELHRLSPEVPHPLSTYAERAGLSESSSAHAVSRASDEINLSPNMPISSNEPKEDIKDHLLSLIDKRHFAEFNEEIAHFDEQDRPHIIRDILNHLTNTILINKDKQLLIDDMNKFISILHAVNLENSEKLVICENLFAEIRNNKLPSGEKIYQSEQDEQPSLLAQYLPPGRPVKQIELIKLLKGAYVDIVTDASDRSDENPEEWFAVQALAEKRAEKIQERGLVDFQNSNTPINISETGTRKKIKELLAAPLQRLKGDENIYQAITEQIIKDLKHIVFNIQKAQREGKIDEMKQLVKDYLGRRKFGILERNYREDFIKIASEYGDDEDNNPLLKLARIAGPELRKSIAETEIMESHFWKGHVSTQKLINEAMREKAREELHTPGIPAASESLSSLNIIADEDEARASTQLTSSTSRKASLEEFQRYSANIKEKEVITHLEMERRFSLLRSELNKIKSHALKNFWLQQINHVRIDLMSTDQFAKALDNFIKPMIDVVNNKYQQEHDFPLTYTEFNDGIKAIKRISFKDSGILWNVDFANTFNKMMLDYKNLQEHEKLRNQNFQELEKNIDEYERQLIDVVLYFHSGERYSGPSPSEFEVNIKKLFHEIEKVSKSMAFIQLKDEKLDQTQLEEYREILKPVQELLYKIKHKLDDYQSKLEIIRKILLAADLNADQQLQYQRLLDPDHGVEAQLNILQRKRKEFEIIEKEQFAKLTEILSQEDVKGLLGSFDRTFTNTFKKFKETFIPSTSRKKSAPRQ